MTDASIHLSGSTAACAGEWTSRHLHRVETVLRKLRWPSGAIEFDMRELASMDTAGAWILHRTMAGLEHRGHAISVNGLSKEGKTLLDLVASRADVSGPPPKPYSPSLLESVGLSSTRRAEELGGLLAFIGELAVVSMRTLLTPARMRWAAVFKEIKAAGFDALPIVGLLAALMGVVIAYQGGIVLRDYGANIFIADLVGISMLRELAPLVTAIIVAGRTGSAYTAQIGTMKVTEEIDALRSLGIAPTEILVLPKLVALVISLPLLTVFADITGVLGGMLMTNAMLDVGFSTFTNRLFEAIVLSTYLTGIGKAPVFAAIIALVGCFQGFRVSGGAESVGRQTTISVVQSIFLVIVADAAFSVIFAELDL